MHSVQCILAELNSHEQNSSTADSKKAIPFPEFGVDFILHHKNESDFSLEEGSSSSESESSEAISGLVYQSSDQDWEDNWLFRRKRPPGSVFSLLNSGSCSSLTMLTDDPVAMLVPLPNEMSQSKALIGEKDVDEVSELSEHCSDQDSLEDSSSFSSSESEENDLEHTEYSVTPLIRSSISISRGSAKEMIKALKNHQQADLNCPKFLEIRPKEDKITCQLGQVVEFQAVTSGQKPIGKKVDNRFLRYIRERM